MDTNGVDNIKLLIVQEFKRIISNGNDTKVFKSVLIKGATRHIASHVVSMRESYIILNSVETNNAKIVRRSTSFFRFTHKHYVFNIRSYRKYIDKMIAHSF